MPPGFRFNEPFQVSHSMFKSLSRWSTNQCEPHNISKHTTRFQLKKGVDVYGISNHEALGCAALKSSAATALLSFNLWRNKQDVELLTKERITNAEQEGATGWDMGVEKNLHMGPPL